MMHSAVCNIDIDTVVWSMTSLQIPASSRYSVSRKLSQPREGGTVKLRPRKKRIVFSAALLTSADIRFHKDLGRGVPRTSLVVLRDMPTVSLRGFTVDVLPMR